jgi:hypothetical protein
VSALLGWLAPSALIVAGAGAAGLLVFGVGVAASLQPGRSERRRVALRCAVAVLHLLQPVARTWGRLRGGRRRTSTLAPEPWTGDRSSWLEALERHASHARTVTRCGAPSDRWDLRVAHGPFVTARVSVAVSWQWSPRVAVRYRPRPSLPIALLGAVAFALTGPAWAVVLVPAVVAVAALDAFSLARRVRRIIAVTTAGATVTVAKAA